MSTTKGVGVLGWGVLPLAILCVLPMAKAGWRDQGSGIAACRISDRQLTLLTGTDTGIKRCKRSGTTVGCPGKSCTGVDGAICVSCNHEPIWNEECSTSGPDEPCAGIQLNWCKDRNPPLTGARGRCDGNSCFPDHPNVFVGCGVYSTCHD